MTATAKYSLKLFCILLIAETQLAVAQQRILVFENIFNGKKTALHPGDEVRMRFMVKDTLDAPFAVAVDDITITATIVSITNRALTLATKNKYFDHTTVSVPYDVIISFRKYSPLRPLAKTGSTILASTIGLLASIQISKSNEVLSWQNAGLALGASSALILNKTLFSDRMKIYTVEGWRPRLQYVMQRRNANRLSPN